MKNNYKNSLFAVLEKTKKPLKIKKLIIPNPGKDQILIKIIFTYICGTQLNEINGNKGKDKYLPHTLGHEASGKIIKIGSNVKNFKVGENVILSWIKKKIKDTKTPFFFDLENKKINSGHISTFSNLTLVSKSRVYKSPKNLPLDIAALLGCAVPTGFGIVLKYSKKISKNAYVGVYGVGGVGLMSIIALKALGFKNIYAVDKDRKKLQIAKNFGCKYIFNTNNSKNLKKISLSLDKEKIKFNIELSGNIEMMEFAYNNLSKNGIFVLAGNPKKGQKIKINPYDLIFGKKIFGFSGNDISLQKNINIYSKIIKRTGIKKLRKIYNSYFFKNINKAIEDFNKGKVLRPLIKL